MLSSCGDDTDNSKSVISSSSLTNSLVLNKSPTLSEIKNLIQSLKNTDNPLLWINNESSKIQLTDNNTPPFNFFSESGLHDKIAEWEEEVILYLPYYFPKSFYIRLIACLKSMSKEVLEGIANHSLQTIINMHFEPYQASYLCLRDVLKDAKKNYKKYGLYNEDALNLLLEQTLYQLGVGPCKHISGGFISNNNNTDESLLDVSILYMGAIYFNNEIKLESHLTLNTTTSQYELNQAGNQLLRRRIKSFWNTLLTTATINGIKVLSLIAPIQDNFSNRPLVNFLCKETNINFISDPFIELKCQLTDIFEETLKELLSEKNFELFYVLYYKKEITEEAVTFEKQPNLTFISHQTNYGILVEKLKRKFPTLKMACSHFVNPLSMFSVQVLDNSLCNPVGELSLSYLTQLKIFKVEIPTLFFLIYFNALLEEEPKKIFAANDNPFLIIHLRFIEPQFFEGWEQLQLTEFSILVNKLMKGETSFSRYGIMHNHEFGLHTHFSGSKYFLAREILIKLSGNTKNTDLSSFDRVKNLNFSFWSQEICHHFDEQIPDNKNPLARRLFEAYYQAYMSVLKTLQAKPEIGLTHKEKNYLAAMQPSLPIHACKVDKIQKKRDTLVIPTLSNTANNNCLIV